MKITIEKKALLTIDTSIERKRINKAWGKNTETRTKLNRFMDFVEKCDWERAGKELESKWWKGRDKKLECDRMEFIGFLADGLKPSPYFDRNATYSDLVWAMCNLKENYKLVSAEEEI